MLNTIPIERSKTQKPCLWEYGGRGSTTGKVQIVAASDGSKKKAIFFRYDGDLSCKNHALIPVEIGDFVIRATISDITTPDLENAIVDLEIARISTVNQQEVTLVTTNMLDGKIKKGSIVWHYDLDSFLRPAIDATLSKLQKHHCRAPYYAIEPVYADSPQPKTAFTME